MEILGLALLFFGVVLPLMLVARLIGILFSKKSLNIIIEHPYRHIIWFIYVVIIAYFLLFSPVL